MTDDATASQNPTRPTPVLEAAETRTIAEALQLDYEPFLRPGERILLQTEGSDAYVFARLTLRSADRRFQLALEAALELQDQPAGTLPGVVLGRAGLGFVMDLLRVQLYEYFRTDRALRFPLEWTELAHGELVAKLRGEQSSPLLEEQADALLEAHHARDGVAEA